MSTSRRNARSAAARRARARGLRRGVVMFIVLVAVVMLTLAGLSFVVTLSTENKAVHLYGDELQLQQTVASGEELLKALCEQSPKQREQAGGLFDNPGRFQGSVVVETQSGQYQPRFSILSPRIEEDEIRGVRFGAQNESGRLNLAALLQWEKQQPGAAEAALMSLPGMTESIAAAILDWIDDDDAQRAGGAEADYYAGLGLPYHPRNAIPTSLDELLLIRDVSRELLFGDDLDFNYQVEEGETQSAYGGLRGSAARGGLPWASLLTVYSAERNSSYDGKPRIHLNQKDLKKLHADLKEVFDPEWADFIIAYRQHGPVEDEWAPGLPGPVRARSGLAAATVRRSGQPGFPRAGRGAPEAIDLDLSQPAKFQIASVLDLIGARVELPAPDAPDEEGGPQGGLRQSPSGGPLRSRAATRRPRPKPPAGPERRRGLILESPFPNDRAAMPDYLPDLVDRLTVIEDEVIRGRINVNLAPRAVLSAVPGLEQAAVDQIVSARGGPLSDDAGRRHATWLLTEGIVDLDQMKALLPYLTTGGDVFRAQVVAWLGDSGPSARAEVVVDATVSPPRQVYWKDLRLLGPGYSLETLGAESPAGLADFSPELEDVF